MSNTNFSKKKEECIQTINTIFENYENSENSEYMLNRIYSHIVIFLPNTLKNEYNIYEKRLNRNTFLTNEQHIFIQVFLSKNKYYYLPNNGLYYEYDGKNYSIVKEDDIIHKLLSTISKDRILLDWKHKTKTNVLKLIKERSLFSSIPETYTIQNVLNFIYPSIFLTKNQAKYFLTIIGDNILKKNSHLLFYVNIKMKKLLTELDTIAYISIGNTNTTNNFIAKYHDNHSFDNYRLININDNFSLNIWKEQFKKFGLDFLCVATHYSKRYEHSEKFIETKCDEEFKNYTLYLNLNTQQQIIDKFCEEYILKTTNPNFDTHCIAWKNIHFIWKQFLSNSQLPNIIYSYSLKNILKEKFNFNEQTDSFIGITSKYLPIESDFIKFFEKTISFKEKKKFSEFDDELEIDELCCLFKIWVKTTTNETLVSNGNITEDNVIKILKHFFSKIEIFQDKYLLNTSCILWNKINDINKSFEYIKTQIKNNNLELISFDEAYNYYYNFCNKNLNKLIISKRYFEKYIFFKLTKYVVYDKFITSNCFLDNYTFE